MRKVTVVQQEKNEVFYRQQGVRSQKLLAIGVRIQDVFDFSSFAQKKHQREIVRGCCGEMVRGC